MRFLCIERSVDVWVDEMSLGESIVHLLFCFSLTHEGVDLPDLLPQEGRADRYRRRLQLRNRALIKERT